MIILVLVIAGLAFGSFVNALTWRIYQQEEKSKTKTTIKGKKVDLRISTGRSVCVHCGHELAAKDLIPVLSWLSLGGKCRYCKKPIEDSPLAEVVTAALFVLSYAVWPFQLHTGAEWVAFVFWLVIVVGLIALAVYDLRHLILPNRIVFPLMGVALAMRITMHLAGNELVEDSIFDVVYGLLVGGGIFYLLFQISNGKWIGGGDVKLGFLIGIALGPMNSVVALLSAFYIAAIIVLPLMVIKKVNRKSKIPFGPFLIIGMVLAMLWGDSIREAYNNLFGL